ncbi:GntR family transcriptional regulator [Pseudaestuariivita atlantica]|uniref:GntR family transcriptional regulator n=1 Tax=Pseudaestuariivita atlantica TaxID=1317121 RepID=A0A0L1JRS5_9RHOB|nr:GntR family transcriptional regulator [Pseudaestuariivita atlantica]KNG94440.1 GntR family transcriptional regulator [Pseudaestuariivita atlantica]
MPDHATLPIYVQLSELLIREIAAGRYIEGDKLPPERDLAASLGTSVGTLRKALAELTARGFLERRQGSGNYVRIPDHPDNVYALFRVELLEGGGLPTAEVLSVDRRSKPRDLPHFGPSAEGHRIRRLRSLSGQVAVLEEIWLDGDRTGTLSAADLSESLYLHYRTKLGFWVSQAEDRVGLAPVPDWAPPTFGVATGAPCVCITRVSWDHRGQAVEASRNWIDTRVATYVARIR